MKTKSGSRLRIPVTHGLKDLYAMDMHLAYQAACAEQFNVISFSRLAAAVSVVRFALTRHKTKIPDAITTLDIAVNTLQTVRTRGDATGVWEITENERPGVLNGIEMAEHCIGTLHVALLEQTAQLLLQQLYGEQSTSPENLQPQSLS
jgi:hypothetical protein